jgi:hypothetical protein
MRPNHHDGILRVPEPLENGLAFLEYKECEDSFSPEATLYSSDDLYIPEERTSEKYDLNSRK